MNIITGIQSKRDTLSFIKRRISFPKLEGKPNGEAF